MTGRTVAAPGSWRLVVPAGWATLSTAAADRDREVKRLLDRQFAGTARDELIQVRVEIDRTLKRDLAQAAENGVTQVHALVDPIQGLPVSGTLLVAQLTTGDGSDLGAGLVAMLGEAVGVLEVDRLELAGVPATRRRRRALEAIDTSADAPRIWHTHVDYLVQAHDDALLVLSFVTSTDPVADQMVDLFDAIAATLHVEHHDTLEWNLVERQ